MVVATKELMRSEGALDSPKQSESTTGINIDPTPLNHDQIYQAAVAASDYANAYIKKSPTRLSNNYQNLKKQLYLDRRIGIFREEIYADLASNPTATPSQRFGKYCSRAKEKGIGSCGEFAFLALEKIINEYSHIFAEVYFIQGGDHVFLVINRDQNSNPTMPETWGSNAYICDPWAKQIYRASEWQSKLKNYCASENFGDMTSSELEILPKTVIIAVATMFSRGLEPIDPIRHQLIPQKMNPEVPLNSLALFPAQRKKKSSQLSKQAFVRSYSPTLFQNVNKVENTLYLQNVTRTESTI